MNSAVQVILIVVGIIVATIIVVGFGEAIVEFLAPFWVAFMWISSFIGLGYGVFVIIQAVQSNNGGDALVGCIVTFVCGLIFVFGLIAVLDWLGVRRR